MKPGSLDDYAEFVAAQTPMLLGFARVLTGNSHDAWDLVQDTLVRMRIRWARIDRGGNPAAYARTTMARLNIDRLRRLRRELLTSSPEDSEAPAELRLGLEPWLVDALAGLTPRQRTALGLRFVADLDIAGIAGVMGCSQGTVKSHLSRGLARIRGCAPKEMTEQADGLG